VVKATAVHLLVQQRRHRYGRFEPEKVNCSAGLAQEIGSFGVARLTRPLGHNNSEELMDRPAKLVALARELADSIPEFQAVRGPGAGDRSTHSFMRELRAQAESAFGQDFSEKKICGETAFAVDFYFPEEAAIVEVALGLPNPNTEFEKDILKAIIAQDNGYEVGRLLFISRPGGERKCSQPGRAAVIRWACEKHAIRIEIHDLGGEPRRRSRHPRAAAQDSPA
jgi:hypothetical protein